MGRWFSYFLNRKECITIASTELKTSVTYEATGEQTVFNIPFDYLRNSFVKAKIGDDGEPMEYGTDYEVANRQITFTTAPVGMLYVYRETPTDRMVQFMEGSVLKANDMNISTLQQLHIIEENEDWMIDNSFVPNEDKNWDAKERRIINTADPVDAQDVVTKNYMETVQNGFVQQNTALKNEATKQANIATQKAQLATEKADTATQQANRAQAWAESEESPDGEIDADSPTGDTMSAKEWTLYAKEIAENMGNPVTDVDEENGTVTVTKSNGTQSSFKAGINILQRNKTYAVEDIAYSFGLPSWAYLECTEAGTTAATEPSFASATTPGTYVTDGTAEFILCDIRDGTPVGRVVYAETLQDGYLKYNGATVLRSDYKRPCRYATKKNLFYDADDTYTFMGTTAADSTTITGISAADIEKLQTAKQVCGDGILITGTGIADDCMIDTINEDSVTITVAATAAGTVKVSYGNIHNYPYMYGIGDGTSTFVLPDYRGRFIMGGDNCATVAPGLPNISGEIASSRWNIDTDSQSNSALFRKSGNGLYGSTETTYYTHLCFDASRSNPIYGNAETVQPPTIMLIPQIRY